MPLLTRYQVTSCAVAHHNANNLCHSIVAGSKRVCKSRKLENLLMADEKWLHCGQNVLMQLNRQ